MFIYPLENPVMPYPWGSTDGFSRFLGLANPGGGPQAELWMGAHPKAPSIALMPGGRRPLDELIRADPAGSLGKASLERHGSSLPFLFKVLSAAKPLSIQVHPDRRRAERGFKKEQAAGLASDAPERSYRDSNHKPELTVALSRFEALVGFRPIELIIATMREIFPNRHLRNLDGLEKRPNRMELSVFFYSILTLSEAERRSLLDTVVARVPGLLATAERKEAERLAWVSRLAALWPGDIGALSPLLFNHLVLEPGEALFIGPGEPHAYLGGTALEIMANSDNVIRAALTDKFVDIPEFVSVLNFELGKPALVTARADEAGDLRYPVPVSDFSLSRLDAASGGTRVVEGPEILLCVEGRATVASGGTRVELGRGQSAFVGAQAGLWSLEGEGVLWRARTGGADPGSSGRS